MGCVAYISPDGMRVGVRHLQCRSSDGKWQLSEESPLGSVTEAHSGSQLVHLSWNETGSELAVVDCLGRVSIYSLSMALNSITGLRQASFDSSDDSNQIVGMMWLNTSRSVGHDQSRGSSRHTSDTMLGSCLPSSSQGEWPLGLFAVSSAADWSFSPCEQGCSPLRDPSGPDQALVSKSRQQVGRASRRIAKHGIFR